VSKTAFDFKKFNLGERFLQGQCSILCLFNPNCHMSPDVCVLCGSLGD